MKSLSSAEAAGDKLAGLFTADCGQDLQLSPTSIHYLSGRANLGVGNAGHGHNLWMCGIANCTINSFAHFNAMEVETLGILPG